MLISLSKAIQKHGMKITGVIHVGAHYGQEYTTYRAAGVQKIMFFEPCRQAFDTLAAALHSDLNVHLYKCACGSFDGDAIMNTETANTGMSNSLLKPAKHLEQYPSIQFTDTERVRVARLDTILSKMESFETRKEYNLLTMDVQGYELEVLKGAPETLKHIDYIYCEVNRDEVYEGCAKVWELDAFLKDFTRVETSWAGNWGDSIYLHNKFLL